MGEMNAMKRMTRVLMILGVVMFAAATMAAQAPPAGQVATDLSGKWTMKVSGGPHGDAAMSLVLKQDGEKVAATFNPGHDGDIPMSGTFVKGALTLKSPANDEGAVITMKGTLKADGSLSGFLSSAMGDMTWSAARDKSK
jgi:hypothetical protein